MKGSTVTLPVIRFVLLATILSACTGGSAPVAKNIGPGGSSSTSSTPEGDTAPTTPTNNTGGGTASNFGSDFSGLKSAAEAMWANYGPAVATPLTQVPTAGSATYSGVASVSSTSISSPQIIATARRVGRVDLVVNFGSNSFAGRAYAFQSVDPGTTTSGEVTLAGSVYAGDFLGALSGKLTDTSASLSETVTMSGTVTGELLGSGAEAVRLLGTGPSTGSVTGTVSDSIVITVDR